MRIGIDFDNTIACYDGVFHEAAVARGLIETTLPRSKNSVRDHLNGTGRADAFTELQGYVYGARMDLVAPYEGVLAFVTAAHAAGHAIFVISHKTTAPILGPRYDLHAAARGFLERHGFTAPSGVIAVDQTFFEVTKTAKVSRATALGIDVFIDDLPDILTMDGWAPGVRKLLFDPNGTSVVADESIERVRRWDDIRHLVLGR